ncbi:hypothetical protein CRUP_005824, partial [Coryphaenoides rupestris]
GHKGLVAVWLLLLHAAAVHGRLLHADDLRDAQPPQREPPHRAERAPQAAEGGGQGRLLPGGDLRPVLVPPAPQQDPQLPPGLGLLWHQPGDGQLLHQSHHPLLCQQEVQELLQDV